MAVVALSATPADASPTRRPTCAPRLLRGCLWQKRSAAPRQCWRGNTCSTGLRGPTINSERPCHGRASATNGRRRRAAPCRGRQHKHTSRCPAPGQRVCGASAAPRHPPSPAARHKALRATGVAPKTFSSAPWQHAHHMCILLPVIQVWQPCAPDGSKSRATWPAAPPHTHPRAR